MGWVVYDQSYHMIRYHKRAATAKAAVTRYNRAKERGEHSWPRVGGCCSYRDYEGLLMGLRGDAFRMWQFVNSKVDL